MSEPNTVCLSVAPNLRCINLSQLQFEVLIIPPAIELIFSISLVLMKRGSGSRMDLLLAAEGIIYFILALIDLLSHVLPAARSSLSIFKTIDIFVGSTSFIPLLLYTTFLLWLSLREFIPNLPLRHQALPKYLLFAFIPAIIAINEVSSFVGTDIRSLPLNMQNVLVIGFTRSLWLSLSKFSLAIYTSDQVIYFLLAFYRLGKAFLDQRRIESTETDEHHFFNGIGWITVGVKLGAIETIVGFAQGSLFAVPLARRILRLLGRASLIIGVLKGLDTCENFENLTDELRGTSRRSRRISNFRDFVTNPRLSTFRRLSRMSISPARNGPAHEFTPTERKDQRVTVHYANGQAPFLQIRFSALDFPAPAILAEGTRRRSWSGILQSYNNPSNPQLFSAPNISGETLQASQNTLRRPPRAKSAMPSMQMGDISDWEGRPFRGATRPESGQTISDNLSVVRDLALQFPSLPPRVTGRYRGSILGQGYEEDPYPVVGISRETSLKKDDEDQSAEAGASLSISGSIKRKPAPPLLPETPFTSRREARPVSTWGGITTRLAEDHTTPSPLSPTSPWTGTTAYSPRPVVTPAPDDTLLGSATPRKFTPRNLINRASRALSDASVRSAEWFASTRSQLQAQTQLTPASIELYRSGAGPVVQQRLSTDPSAFTEDVVSEGTPGSPVEDDWTYHAQGSGAQLGASRPQRPKLITKVSVGRVPMRTTPTPTHVEFGQGRERVLSSSGSVGDTGDLEVARGARPERRSRLREEYIGPGESFFLTD